MSDSAVALQYVNKALSELQLAVTVLAPSNAFRPVVEFQAKLVDRLAKQLKADAKREAK